MGFDIKFLGRTHHFGEPSKPRSQAEASRATGQTKSGRSVSVASDTQPSIPKGKRPRTTKALVTWIKTIYANHTTGKKLGVGYKEATKELSTAVKKQASPEDIKKTLSKHTSGVSSLNTLLSQLPKRLQHNESVAHAVRLYVPELLIQEDRQSSSTPASVASSLQQLRKDHAEVIGSNSVDLHVSINQRLQNAPTVDLILRGSNNDNFNEQRLRGVATTSLQALVNFHQAQHLQQKIEEDPKLVDDPKQAVAELKNVMYDLSVQLKDNETKQMPVMKGNPNAHYLSQSQYESVQNQAPKERVEVPDARPATPKPARPAPAVPGQSAIHGQIKTLSTQHSELAPALQNIEKHFLGLQTRGVEPEQLQQLVLQYPDYAESGWSPEQFIQLCDHAVDALRTNTTQDIDHALRIGYEQLGQ